MGGNRGPAPGRPYDVLYDPVYTVSGARDHYRQQAQSSGYVLEKVPNFQNFFSEVPTFPAASIRLKSTADVPAFVPREFRPGHEAPHELQARSTSGNVSGANLGKFLHQPMLSLDDRLQSRATSGVKFTSPNRAASAATKPTTASAQGVQNGPKSVTVGTQSDYRESEAQTVPYSPDYVIPEGAPEPEILALQELKHDSGLPGSVVAVQLVNRMRIKREFEATLPPLNGTEQELNVRKRMMEAWERQEWADRENDIAQAQEDRLGALVAQIEQREAEREEEIKRRVEALRATKEAERSKASAGIQKRRIQTLRKLTQARAQGDKATSKRDIIAEYADYGSRVYAPVTRSGEALTRKATVDVDPRVTEPASLPGMEHLEASLSRKTLPRVISPPGTTEKKLSLADARMQGTVRGQLEHIDNLLQTSKTMSNGTRGMGDAWPCPLDSTKAEALAKTRSRVPRSRKKATGRVFVTVESEDQREKRKRRRAVIFLQSLLRGCAAQVALYETRDQLRALVGELQSAIVPTAEPPQGTSEPLIDPRASLDPSDATTALPPGTLEPSEGARDIPRAPSEPLDAASDLRPGSSELPPALVSLEAFKERGLGEVLGDMLGALSIEDVAQRRATLLEIETRHAEEKARLLKEEQEEKERQLREAEALAKAKESPLNDENHPGKENREESARTVKISKRHHKHRSHHHHNDKERGYKGSEGGYKEKLEEGDKGEKRLHKEGESGHKLRERKTHFAADEAGLLGLISDVQIPDGRSDEGEERDPGVQNNGERALLEKDGRVRNRTSYSGRRSSDNRETDVGSQEEETPSIGSASLSAKGSRRGSLVAGSLQQEKQESESTEKQRVRFTRSRSGKEEVDASRKGERAESGTEQEPEGEEASASDSGSWSEGESSGSESEGSYSDKASEAEAQDEQVPESEEFPNAGRPKGRPLPWGPGRACPWTQEEGDKAATRIQACFRGHQDRVLVNRMKQGL